MAVGAVALMIGMLAALVVAGLASAQGGKVNVTDDQVNAIARRLNCPVCENVPLDVCETQACAQWRDLIRQKLAAGQTPDEIMTYFQATYGDRVLQAPPRSGFTGLVWILPFVGLVAGLAILVVVLRRLTARPAALAAVPSGSPEQPSGAAGVDPETDTEIAAYRKRLERELEELE